jgi:hypothetical protein
VRELKEIETGRKKLKVIAKRMTKRMTSLRSKYKIKCGKGSKMIWTKT